MIKKIKENYSRILLIIFFFYWMFNVFNEYDPVNIIVNITAMVLILVLNFIKYKIKDKED